jgi:hypothetical protein
MTAVVVVPPRPAPPSSLQAVVVVTASLDADKDNASRREDDAKADAGTVGNPALPGKANC